MAFLSRPGLPGAFGALKDETARAAEDFCRVIETQSIEKFGKERPSEDPDTVSIRALCAHTIGACRGYAGYIRKARGMPFVERFRFDPTLLSGPRDVRPHLEEAIQYLEDSVEGLAEMPDKEVAALTFQTRWGATYDPEMIMEHGIVHLLRHRRQVERWPE